MRLYKRGEIYWCWFYDRQKRRVRTSTKCTDRRAAESVAARLEREAADPRRAAANQTSLRDALSRLVLDRQTRARAEGTIKMYRTKGGQLTRVLGGDTPLANIDATSVDRFIAKRLEEGAKRNTIGKELTALRSALKVAKRRGEFLGDVAEVMPVQWSAGYKPRARVLRKASDLQKLVDELLPDRGAHVCYIIASASRISESHRARRTDIDLDNDLLRVRGTKTDASDATIPIVGWMRPLMEHVIAVRGDVKGPMFRKWGNVGRELAEACDRAGIERLSPNDLRRTHATWLATSGVEPSLLAGMLRHKDTRMVERVYGRIAPDALGALLSNRLGEKKRKAAKRCDTRVTDDRGQDGGSGRSGQQKPSKFVPRDGIEPPTRGFSVRPSKRRNDGK